jgi:hypothetical protein
MGTARFQIERKQNMTYSTALPDNEKLGYSKITSLSACNNGILLIRNFTRGDKETYSGAILE